MSMRLALEIILKLSIEQKLAGLCWPHPWDHYPFIKDDGHIWLRYRDLDSRQRTQIRRALAQIARRLAEESLPPGCSRGKS
jgi:hypothetical protein